jgi:hypothetical protein
MRAPDVKWTLAVPRRKGSSHAQELKLLPIVGEVYGAVMACLYSLRQ